MAPIRHAWRVSVGAVLLTMHEEQVVSLDYKSEGTQHNANHQLRPRSGGGVGTGGMASVATAATLRRRSSMSLSQTATLLLANARMARLEEEEESDATDSGSRRNSSALAARRRRAVDSSDLRTCAMVQSRMRMLHSFQGYVYIVYLTNHWVSQCPMTHHWKIYLFQNSSSDKPIYLTHHLVYLHS